MEDLGAALFISGGRFHRGLDLRAGCAHQDQRFDLAHDHWAEVVVRNFFIVSPGDQDLSLIHI